MVRKEQLVGVVMDWRYWRKHVLGKLCGLVDVQILATVLTRGVGVQKRRRGSLPPHNGRHFR